MKKYYCDKCGEEIKDISVFEDTLVKGKVPHVEIFYKYETLDLCRSCKIELAREIESWRNNG